MRLGSHQRCFSVRTNKVCFPRFSQAEPLTPYGLKTDVAFEAGVFSATWQPIAKQVLELL